VRDRCEPPGRGPRDGENAARYGGGETAVVLPSVDASTALAVAERIRSSRDSALVSLAPGVTGRLRVSIRVKSAPEQPRIGSHC
jgi:diguanylate cyclase (GGDEF)-like protein